MKKLLSPLFRIISKPGIINPHTPYEAELMVAGIKPVVIIDSRYVSTKMKHLIEIGKIVKIGEVKFNHNGILAQVFSQSNKVKEGKELFARYYKSDSGCHPLGRFKNIA